MSRAVYPLIGVMVIATIAIIVFDRPTAADQDAGVVAYYSFEEGPGEMVKDWSGNGNDGENHGAEYVDLGEGRGFALRFGDGDAYVDCGDRPTLDVSDAVTIELWIYVESAPASGEAGIVGKSLESYVLGYTGINCWWYVDGGGNGIGAQLPPHSWHYLATTFDGTDVTIYIDGVLASTRHSKYPKINTGGGNFYLRYPLIYGKKAAPPFEFKLMMDDVCVYNRALSADEVLSHYEAGKHKRAETVPVRPCLRAPR